MDPSNFPIIGWTQVNNPHHSNQLLDEFGNVHFGMVAAANGYGLAESLIGAGWYQVINQQEGNLINAIIGTPVLFSGISNGVSRNMTNDGFSWGDKYGDSLAIMKGWDYYHANY